VGRRCIIKSRNGRKTWLPRKLKRTISSSYFDFTSRFHSILYKMENFLPPACRFECIWMTLSVLSNEKSLKLPHSRNYLLLSDWNCQKIWKIRSHSSSLENTVKVDKCQNFLKYTKKPRGEKSYKVTSIKNSSSRNFHHPLYSQHESTWEHYSRTHSQLQVRSEIFA
jgi:hypothetical protein